MVGPGFIAPRTYLEISMRPQGGPAKVWPGAEGTGSSTLSDHLLSNGGVAGVKLSRMCDGLKLDVNDNLPPEG